MRLFRLLLVFVLAVTVPLAFSQKAASPKYDKTAEAKYKGTIDDIKNVEENGTTETHLMLKTADKVVEVCLCPMSFLKDMDVKFEKGQEIEVTGAKFVKGDGTEEVLAREILMDKGTNSVVLRDPKGGPVWTWKK
jgi:hypothetical protein